MKPAPFLYARPQTLDRALRLLAENDGEARVVAGGQSLLPLMNYRFSRPSVLVDLGLVDALRSIAGSDGNIEIGAMVTQRAAELSPDVAEHCPLLTKALPHVGHLQIRTRGTVGGSIAHADPAAELPAVAVTVGADMVANDGERERMIPAREFFLGPFTTALEPGEILVAVRFRAHTNARTAFHEVDRRKGDFAIAGIAAVAEIEAGSSHVSDVRLTAFGVAGAPVRLMATEQNVAGRELSPAMIEASANTAREEVEPWSDTRGSAEYRRELVGTLVRRALQDVA